MIKRVRNSVHMYKEEKKYNFLKNINGKLFVWQDSKVLSSPSPCSRSRAWMLGTMFSVQSMDAWDRRKALMSDGGMRFESNQQ